MQAAKQEVQELLRELPNDITLEDIQYHSYVKQKIAQGLADLASYIEKDSEFYAAAVVRELIEAARALDVFVQRGRVVPGIEIPPFGRSRLTGAETTLRFEALWKFSFHQKSRPKSPGGRQAPGRNRHSSSRKSFRRF